MVNVFELSGETIEIKASYYLVWLEEDELFPTKEKFKITVQAKRIKESHNQGFVASLEKENATFDAYWVDNGSNSVTLIPDTFFSSTIDEVRFYHSVCSAIELYFCNYYRIHEES